MEIDIQCIAQTFRQYGEAAKLYADMDSFLHDDYDELFYVDLDKKIPERLFVTFPPPNRGFLSYSGLKSDIEDLFSGIAPDAIQLTEQLVQHF